MNIMRRHKYIFIIVALMIVFVSIAYFAQNYFGFKIDRGEIENFVKSFGIFGPVIIILLIVIEVVFAPLPGGAFPVIAGLLFGPVRGILYSWLGNVLGSLIAFLLSRRFGNNVVKFFAPSFNEGTYHNEMARHKGLFFFAYLTPFIPVDVLSFAIGMTKMPIYRFIVIIVPAFLIRMIIWNSLPFLIYYLPSI